MKYHFVYETHSREKLLELDTDREPPEPGESIQLYLEGNSRNYTVNEVSIAPPGHAGMVIFIELAPMRRKKPSGSE